MGRSPKSKHAMRSNGNESGALKDNIKSYCMKSKSQNSAMDNKKNGKGDIKYKYPKQHYAGSPLIH
jgi:hypothetical protein